MASTVKFTLILMILLSNVCICVVEAENVSNVRIFNGNEEATQVLLKLDDKEIFNNILEYNY